MGIENKFGPSAEDIQVAGDKNMTDAQKNLSERRERSSAVLKDKFGIDGYLEYDMGNGISGKINGHKIVLISDRSTFSTFRGTIDDSIKMNDDDVEKFMDKYSKIPQAITNYNQNELKKAQVLELPSKDEVLKDIGL